MGCFGEGSKEAVCQQGAGKILEFFSKVLEFQGYMDVNWQVIVSSGKQSW